MQLTKTVFLDSVTFIEKKKVENWLWRKSALCGEKVKNAGEKKKSSGERGRIPWLGPTWTEVQLEAEEAT